MDKDTFEKVVAFCNHLSEGNSPPEIQKPLKSKNMRENTTLWYADFIDVDVEKTQDILLAGDFLGIRHLVNLCTAKMGSFIRGMSITEIRRTFNIVNDFTPEEEAIPYDPARVREMQEEFQRQNQGRD